VKKITALLLLLTVVAFHAPAQTNTTSTTSDPPPFPQWARDIRRWEIVLFGSFPFSMFTVTFVTDMVRWNDHNGLDFSETGRKYAPWPLKSAGAIAMTNDEQIRTITLAVGVSAAVAFADLLIVQVKRYQARRRAEALPVGTAIIIRTPLPNDTDDQEATPESEAQPEQENQEP
jgi:hypothetical protein